MKIFFTIKVLSLAFFVTFFSKNAQSQSCYDIYEDALYLSTFTEYEHLADSLLDIEIADGNNNFNIYLLKAKLLYLRGNSIEGFNNLKVAIRFGCDLGHHIFTNRFFKKHLTRSDSINLIKQAPNLIEVPIKTANPLALPELYQLQNFDQALRYFTTKYRDSICVSETKALSYELKISRKLLREYLNNFGFPNEKEFGTVMLDRFDKVIIHHKSEIDSCEWLKYYYDKALLEGKISPERYFNFYETFRIEKNQLQQTGSFAGRLRINGNWEVYPIENIDIVDELRKKNCLCPLHVYLKNNNFIIPEGYSFEMNDYVRNVRNKIRQKN